MKLEGKKIGFVITASFCNFSKAVEEMKKIKLEHAEIIPIMSYNAYNIDTKFGKAKDYIEKIEKIARKKHNPYNTRSRTNRA